MPIPAFCGLLPLGRLALAYEAQLLGLPEHELLDEMIRRFEIMRSAVHEGLAEGGRGLQLLDPASPRIMQADAAGRLAIAGAFRRVGHRRHRRRARHLRR